jgi:hypothetical protein
MAGQVDLTKRASRYPIDFAVGHFYIGKNESGLGEQKNAKTKPDFTLISPAGLICRKKKEQIHQT